MDFGPALLFLAEHAPLLASLAVHGLDLPAAPLLRLAEGCPSLSRLHLVGCTYPEDGLDAFLGAANALTHLNLRDTDDLPGAQLQEWIENRLVAGGKPVRYLGLIHCHFERDGYSMGITAKVLHGWVEKAVREGRWSREQVPKIEFDSQVCSSVLFDNLVVEE